MEGVRGGRTLFRRERVGRRRKVWRRNRRNSLIRIWKGGGILGSVERSEHVSDGR